MICAIAAAVAWPFFVPVKIAETKPPDAMIKKGLAAKLVAVPTDAEFATVWDKPLQRPLVDPVIEKTVETIPEPPRVAKPNWRLVGVFWKEAAPASSLATIQTGPKPADRKYVSVGDTVMNAKVIKINESAMIISVDGQEFEFALSDK